MVVELEAPCRPEELFAWVEDLERYPRYIGIVTRAERLPAAPAEAPDGPAWAVDLRGQLGPLARSKRLRMVRTVHDAPRSVVFERAEVDGRSHSTWVMRADVSERAAGAAVRMQLTYDGSLFGPIIERVLRDEIDRSRDRLLALVTGGSDAT